jgi:ornithine cyclodeaminase/alanine dehydrogenase-like protein (mu-crystallin family)
MTLHLDSATIRQLCDEQVAYEAARRTIDGQRSGQFALPPRMDVDVPTGFFRTMPAALGEHMGAKIMTLAKGVGNRYLLLVYRQATGELLATLDASEVTRLRTAATTVVAGSMIVGDEVSELGLIGTGFEAAGHLEAFAAKWPLRQVTVFSRSAERREAFAARYSAELGIEVRPVADVAEVTGRHAVTVLCTKATEPVVDGTTFAPGATVLSIGATRPNLRELDEATFARARSVLVDDVDQMLTECGDVRAAVAAGVLAADDLVAMPSWPPPASEPRPGRDVTVFKSVGTALQDLALAAGLIERATDRGLGRDIGEITELKAVPGAKAEVTS